MMTWQPWMTSRPACRGAESQDFVTCCSPSSVWTKLCPHDYSAENIRLGRSLFTNARDDLDARGP